MWLIGMYKNNTCQLCGTCDALQLTVLAMQQGLVLLGTVTLAMPSGIWCLVWMFLALRSAACNNQLNEID